MLVALAEDEDTIAKDIQRIVLEAPCYLGSDSEKEDLSFWGMQSVDEFRHLGIYSFPSMDWRRDRAKICWYGSWVNCALAYFIPDTYPSYDSMKAWEHFKQQDRTQIFQPFIDDWEWPYE